MATLVSGRARLWLPALLWAGVIFAFSSIPSLGTGLGVWDLVLRKLAHTVEFAVFAALVYRAGLRAPVALAIGSAYAATDELHQSFVRGRQAAVSDWAIDTAGVALGLAVLFLWRRRA